MSYTLRTDKTVAETAADIKEEFRKWHEPEQGYSYDSVVGANDFPAPSGVGGSSATVRFELRGKRIDVTCDSQTFYRDNLRCCYFAIKGMRLNEARGIADTMRKAYLMLDAPKEERDPYEVLGVRPDAVPEIITAAFKVGAKRYHPDTGGDTADDAKFAELKEAYDKVKA